MRDARPGEIFPLGAHWTGKGTNFALFSRSAVGVELCLVDESGAEERIPMFAGRRFVWSAFLPGVGPGQRYAYRVHGPYAPERGLRFNPRVRLLDPYARAVSGGVDWAHGAFAYDLHAEEKDLRVSEQDAVGAPLGLVVDDRFDWGDDRRPRVPYRSTVIYEAHVRGLTMRHPEVPPELRGTYLGMGHPAIIKHLKELGVTAVELLPVHSFVDDAFLTERGLRNYWGYSTLCFFAPETRYRSGAELGAEVRQFKTMVKALHAAGIEVILDVVYNHTAEGNHLGPTLSLKGIDNPTYYRLTEDARFYFDYTGTGNTLNTREPQTLKLIMDSLRYWATEMRVDGFRFDLASALARGLHAVDQLSSFFTIIHQDPILAPLKLIAEPWDVGPGGYQVGNFPVAWAEWNGRYRDTVRAFWKGDPNQSGELGFRLTGSADLYADDGRRPTASINFITCHDGFTLRDLVSYDHKHNEANGENNCDGADHNLSWGCGAEGPTDNPEILALRARQQRNLLATLFFSLGTPMLLAGDELGHTQRGNNNTYCQDNELTHIDWDLSEDQRALLAFTRKVIRLRREHPSLARTHFVKGDPVRDRLIRDAQWFRPDGHEMTDEDWCNPEGRALAVLYAGDGIQDVDDRGKPVLDDDLVLLVNASAVDLTFKLPVTRQTKPWELLVDTADDAAREAVDGGAETKLMARSLKLFRRQRPGS